ncbi:MAG: cell division protein FtsX [Ilumatobacteraceae bacterium]
MISRARYMLREMWASMSRNLTLTFATVLTATISLLLFGITLLIQRGFDNQLRLWTGGVEMIVYVENGNAAGSPEVELIRSELLRQTTVVESVEYCDEACATDVATTLFAGDPDALAQLLPQIPSFFKVKPIDKDSSEVLRALRESFDQLPKVIDVRTPDQAVAVLGELKGFFGVRTLVMAVVLLFASALLIWNTIRTAMFARRREIEVMKLVGATNWFIRLPFMMEGLVQGLVGAVLGGLGMLFINNDWTSGVRAFPAESGLEGFVVTDGYPYWVWGAMLVVGALVGAVGSGTAASRFLDV